MQPSGTLQVVKVETDERWMALCKLAAEELDSKRLIELVREIIHLLEEKHKRVSNEEIDES